jgi:hypothetical protein
MNLILLHAPLWVIILLRRRNKQKGDLTLETFKRLDKNRMFVLSSIASLIELLDTDTDKPFDRIASEKLRLMYDQFDVLVRGVSGSLPLHNGESQDECHIDTPEI